ncbi:MAG: hypothetical protein AB7T22_12800 [Calditrichaceae bacterium]
MKVTKIVLILIAALYGLMTIIAGSRVLLGSDPGYVVFKPLLIYNVIMGIVYVTTSVVAWRNIKQGMYLAAAIFSLNLVTLIVIYFLSTNGSVIAADSLRAMSIRTSVWLILFAGFGWLNHKNMSSDVRQSA